MKVNKEIQSNTNALLLHITNALHKMEMKLAKAHKLNIHPYEHKVITCILDH